MAAAPLSRYAAVVAALTLAAFVLRLAAGLAQQAIVPEYAAYYATVAEQVAAGHGLTVPYAWSYLTPAVANGVALPRPAFDVWLPAASLVTVPLVWALGGVLASRIAGAIAGAALVPLVAMLARRTARVAGRDDRDVDIVAVLAAALVAISQPLVTGSITSDSQALFGVTVLAGVLAADRALATGRLRDLVLAGLVLGAGLLTRNETLYLIAAVVAAGLAAAQGASPSVAARGLAQPPARSLAERVNERRDTPGHSPNEPRDVPDGPAARMPSSEALGRAGSLGGRAGLGRARRFITIGEPTNRMGAFGRVALIVAVAAACYAPWAVRQWLVFGTPFPGQTAANAFSVSPNDIFGWSAPPPSLATYLASGPDVLIVQRLEALRHNVVDVLVVPALPWSVIGLVGVVLLWRARPLRLLLATAVLTLLADTLVFPVATLYGTFLHGSAPVLALLAIGAADLGVGATRWAMRSPAGPDAVSAAVLAGVVVAVWCLLGTASGITEYAAWANTVPPRYQALAEALRGAVQPGEVVIATHPSWVWRESGYPAVVLPDEAAASVLSLAAAYRASVVAVDGVDGPWPGAASGTRCLVPMQLPAAAAPITAFRVVCTGR